jgi:hypothetical protein
MKSIQEFPAKRQRIAMIYNGQKKTSCRWLYCNRRYEGILGPTILRNSPTKFLSLLDFGNFEDYSEKFPDIAYEPLLKFIQTVF